MKKGLFARKGVLAAVCFAVTLSACGGGGGGGGSGTDMVGPSGTGSASGSASGATTGTGAATGTTTGTGATGSTGTVSGVTPAPATSPLNLPASTAQLITQRYGATPELQSAATAFANSSLTRWTAARATGVYNAEQTSTAINALSCLILRSARLGQPTTEADIRNLLASLASTPELLRAYIAADKLASGHPQTISTAESEACTLGGVK